MDILPQLVGLAALILAIWIKTGRIARSVAEIAETLAAEDGSATGAALTDRLGAIDMRMAELKVGISEALADSDQAKRASNAVRSQLQRDEEKLTAAVTQAILPQVQALLQQQAPSNNAQPVFLQR